MPRGKNYVNNNKGVTMQAKAGKKAVTEACFYGSACTRPNCIYRHDVPASASNMKKSNEPCMAFLAGTCSFAAEKCRNRHPPQQEAVQLRAKYAAVQCRHGDKCKTSGCLYIHAQDTPFGEPAHVAFPALNGTTGTTSTSTPAAAATTTANSTTTTTAATTANSTTPSSTTIAGSAWRTAPATGAWRNPVSVASKPPAPPVQAAAAATKARPAAARAPAPVATKATPVWVQPAATYASTANPQQPTTHTPVAASTTAAAAATANAAATEGALNVNAVEFVPGGTA